MSMAAVGFVGHEGFGFRVMECKVVGCGGFWEKPELRGQNFHGLRVLCFGASFLNLPRGQGQITRLWAHGP